MVGTIVAPARGVVRPRKASPVRSRAYGRTPGGVLPPYRYPVTSAGLPASWISTM